MSDFKEIFNRIIPYDIKTELKRYGNMNKDGGYIFSSKDLDKSKYIYSYGIGPRIDQIKFDQQMAEAGKTVYMYDGTISQPAKNHENFVFARENVNSENIYEHIVKNGHENETDITAQIDVEGCEYEIFSNCNEKVFDVFSQMNVEYHDMLEYSEEKIKSLERISERYYAFHIHLNNWMLDAAEHPEGWKDGYGAVYEVSYIRKDCLDFTPERYKGSFPVDGLDVPNRPDLEDPEICWWN